MSDQIAEMQAALHEAMVEQLRQLNAQVTGLLLARARLERSIKAWSDEPVEAVDDRPQDRAVGDAATGDGVEGDASLATSPTAPQHRKSPPLKVDYPAVADIANEARLAGLPMTSAVMAHFDKPYTSVNNWLAKCKKLGLIHDVGVPVSAPSMRMPKPEIGPAIKIAKPVPPRVVLDTSPPPRAWGPVNLDLQGPAVDADAALKGSKATYEKIAYVYLDAVSHDLKPIAMIVERWGVHRTTANTWVATCRELGLLRPRDEPQIDVEAPRAAVKHHGGTSGVMV